MIKNLLSLYYRRYPKALVSLMHSTKYNTASYIKQVHKTKDFTTPLKKPAPKTKRTLTVVALLSLGMLAQIAVGIVVIVLGLTHHVSGGIYFGVAIILLYPLVWAYLAALALIIRDWYKLGQSLDKE
jgi:heme A synthase